MKYKRIKNVYVLFVPRPYKSVLVKSAEYNFCIVNSNLSKRLRGREIRKAVRYFSK